jgi:hypothetical protein
MIALTRASNNCKRQTHPLVREDVNMDYENKYSVEKKMLVMILKRLVAKTN